MIGAGTVAALALVAIVAGVLAASGGTPRRPRAQLLFAPGTGGGGSPGMGAPPLQGTSPGLGSGTPQAGGPWLGISLTTSAAGGATVAEVEPGGPADQAGIQQGDVITQLGRNAVHSPSDVTQALASLQVGQQVLVQVQRDGQPVSDVVTLGSRPAGIP